MFKALTNLLSGFRQKRGADRTGSDKKDKKDKEVALSFDKEIMGVYFRNILKLIEQKKKIIASMDSQAKKAEQKGKEMLRSLECKNSTKIKNIRKANKFIEERIIKIQNIENENEEVDDKLLKISLDVDEAFDEMKKNI